MLLYLFFFIGGMFVDKIKNLWFRKIFLFCFYAFFCFGYTTGSDWRAYEILYDDAANREYILSDSLYMLYNAITSFFCAIGVDFWLYTGLVKCVFLYSVIKTIRLFSIKYFAILSIMLPPCLLFMLIDCPFKFMMALIFILFAFQSLLKGQYKKSIILFGASLFVHFAAFVVVLIIIVGYLCRNAIPKMSVWMLFMLLVLLTMLSTILSMFTSLTSMLASALPILEQKLNSYSVESTKGWLTLGTLMNVIMFFIVYYSKSCVLKTPNGSCLYSMSIFYVLLFPIFLIIPTGFRFNMFNSMMCVIAVGVFCFSFSKQRCVYLRFRPIVLVIVMLYYSYSYIDKIYWSYAYLPYTNSISYILTGTSRDNYSNYINEYILTRYKSTN